MLETRMISNLYAYLKKTTADDIVIRTTHVSGGWHDNEFDAHAAGFDIYRFVNKEMAARHEFANCYHLVRRK